MPAKSSRAAALRSEETHRPKGRASDIEVSILSADALDERIAIVGTAGSGKTYAAKGFVERLLGAGARVAVVDPLGVWWGLRASADGAAPGYPVVVFGGRHADVAITAEMGAALGRLIAGQALACVVDLSELGSSAARRRFMAAFAEALYEANEEPLHLVLDEADLWAPQRPIKGWEGLLGHIEEIVRRGRVRGFIPWLITQRPAVVHKDVLSQADILIAMKLTASQDRDAIGAWIEGQADRQEGKRILGELPRLKQGEGYLWAPGHGILRQVRFPAIRTFDSSRTPRRGERLAVPRTLAEVDLTAIVAALAAETQGAGESEKGHRKYAQVERDLAAARARIETLEQENRQLAARLEQIASLAGNTQQSPVQDVNAGDKPAPQILPRAPIRERPQPVSSERPIAPSSVSGSDGGMHPAARKLLNAIMRLWQQAKEQIHTETSSGKLVSMNLRDAGGRRVRMTFPDLSGESYQQMWERRECDPQLANLLGNGQGILLFVHADRVKPPIGVAEVTAQAAALGGKAPDPTISEEWHPKDAPTAVQVVEMLQMLRSDALRAPARRIAIVLSAWDKVEDEGLTPEAFLTRDLPLLDQYLRQGTDGWEFHIYGLSAQGGDYEREGEAADPDRQARVAAIREIEDASSRIRLLSPDLSNDLTKPIAWLIE